MILMLRFIVERYHRSIGYVFFVALVSYSAVREVNAIHTIYRSLSGNRREKTLDLTHL